VILDAVRRWNALDRVVVHTIGLGDGVGDWFLQGLAQQNGGTYVRERGTGRTLHPDNMAAGPASYGMTDTMGRMHSDAQFAGSSSVPAHVEMMGFIGMGNNPMVGASVAVAVALEQAAVAEKVVA
jgi:hypothetical protein